MITCLLVCSKAAQLAARTALLLCRVYTEYVVWKSHADSAAWTGLCPPLAAERRGCRLTRRSLSSTASLGRIGHSGRWSALIGRMQDGTDCSPRCTGRVARLARKLFLHTETLLSRSCAALCCVLYRREGDRCTALLGTNTPPGGTTVTAVSWCSARRR